MFLSRLPTTHYSAEGGLACLLCGGTAAFDASKLLLKITNRKIEIKPSTPPQIKVADGATFSHRNPAARLAGSAINPIVV